MKIEWDEIKDELIDRWCNVCHIGIDRADCPDHTCPVWQVLELCDKELKVL